MSLENDITTVKMMVETNDAFMDHPDPSGLGHAANDPRNCKLVWWYDPRSAEFVKSRDPKHLHVLDVSRNVIKDYQHWVRGRVFQYQGKGYLVVYFPEKKHLLSHQLVDILDKAMNSVDIQIDKVIDDNGRDLHDMLESLNVYTLEHSSLGAWKINASGSVIEVAV